MKSVLQSIDDGKLGFTLVIDDTGKLVGLISNADIRKGLLNHLDNLNAIDPFEFLNEQPTCITENATVLEMLQLIKNCRFPVMYLPVLDKDGFAKGIVTFVNLIKGEL